MRTDESLTVTVEEAGHMLGVGRTTAYELVRTGELPALRLGRRVVVPLVQLRALLERPTDRNVPRSGTMEVMSMTVEFPEPLADRVAAAAERRGMTVDQFVVECVEGNLNPDTASGTQLAGQQAALAAFIGGGDSGDPDWASTDIHELRAELADRKHTNGA